MFTLLRYYTIFGLIFGFIPINQCESGISKPAPELTTEPR